MHPSGSTYIFLKAALAKNGLSLANIKQSTVSPPYENLLLLNRVNVVPGYIDAEVPELEHKAGGPGLCRSSTARTWASRATARASSHRTRTLPSARTSSSGSWRLFQGLRRRGQNPEAAADTLIKSNPEYKGKKEMLVAQLRADLDFTFFSDQTKTHGIGWIDPALWRSSAAIFKERASALAGSFDDTGIRHALPGKSATSEAVRRHHGRKNT